MIDLVELQVAYPLPQDTQILRNRPRLVVLGSRTAGLVYRIGVNERINELADPVKVSYSHHLAWDMHRNGLNVLPPIAATPTIAGRYIVSVYPYAFPLATVGWRIAEPFKVGAAMARWKHYRSSMLQILDIPAYTTYRIRTASRSRNSELRSAAEWCSREFKRLMNTNPWTSFDSTRGCVHGDPNLANLVRHSTEDVPVFIDLDTVKLGPAFYDLAVMRCYNIRLSSEFPAAEITDGYRSVQNAPQAECIDRLREWKEFSSYTQLLTRWHEQDVRTEFWRRTKLGPTDVWQNVVGTTVTHSRTRPDG